MRLQAEKEIEVESKTLIKKNRRRSSMHGLFLYLIFSRVGVAGLYGLLIDVETFLLINSYKPTPTS
jgi:ABC-type tungstate transport system substrate-binding protein